MPRLTKYLLAGRSLTIYNRRVKPRFFFIIGILLIILIIILVLNYETILDKLLPETLFTSPYWQGGMK